MKAQTQKLILLLIILTAFFSSTAFASTGYIDPSATNQAKVCHDATCSSPTPGIINFELSQQSSIVIDSSTGLSGYVWGNELGWINMNPTGEGVRFADPVSGLLTGKAWSQVSGFINFAVTGQSVTINPTTGEFSGWAWTGGPEGGWIKFDCSDSSTCVRTTWRPTSTTVHTGGGGPTGGYKDICPNLVDVQQVLPLDYTIDVNGNCVKSIDVCPNLDGVQDAVPAGYYQAKSGACISKSEDSCPNISGIQKEIPNGYQINEKGNCVKPPQDFCANLPDIQSAVPKGFYAESGNCFVLPKIPETTPPTTYNPTPNTSEKPPISPQTVSYKMPDFKKIPEIIFGSLRNVMIFIFSIIFLLLFTLFFIYYRRRKK